MTSKITIWYSSVDGYEKKSRFSTLKGAQKYAITRLGEHPDFGSYYAVSEDGVGKIEVEGCTLRELFPS